MTISNLRGFILQVTLAIALLASISTAQTLTTTYVTNSGASGNMFDLKTVATGVIINDFDVNLDTGLTTQIDVWAVTGGGSFMGMEVSPTGWTLLASPTVTSAGADMPTNLGLSLGLVIPPASTQGFFLTLPSGSGVNYNIAPAPLFGTVAAADGFLEIYHGVGKPLMPSTYPTAFATATNGGPTVGVSQGRTFSGTVYYVPQSGNADDVALTSITAPVDSTGCDLLTATELVTCQVTNFGTSTVLAGTLLQMDLVVDGGTPISEFFLTPSAMALGQSLPFTFTATTDLSAMGMHTIGVTAMLVGDMDNSNDSATLIVNSGNPNTISTLPWTENFDGAPAQNSTIPPTGWEQDSNDGTGSNADWVMRSGTTASTNTGPHNDHTTGGAGYYAYVEDSSPNQAQVNLLTPCLDLSAATAPLLQFWMASFNGLPASYPDNNLSVDVITYPGGVVTMDVFGPQGSLPGQAATWAANTPFEWQQQTVNLAPYVGQTIQLRFRGQSDQTPQYNDIAIDDVAIFEPVMTPGQAPRPNQAVMDIENAANANLVPVSSGLGGPYFTTVTQGGSFNFSFQGEPVQPIAVVYGGLNPVSATYPGGIGQFDVGGPGVDPQGIPLNLAVFANAIAWAQGGFVGFPFDALFFTNATGDCNLFFSMPNFGIPPGQVLTTFQSAIASSAAPFVYISNAIEVTIN